MSSIPKPTRLSRTSAQPTADELLHFFNQSPDLLCIAGFDGIFKRLNPAWSPLLGWTNEELQARPFLDFVHPEDRAATLAVMDQLDAGTTTLSFENRYRCKDGSWKWLRWTASPLLDRTG
jgi:PAS domain S-box-containing protein